MMKRTQRQTQQLSQPMQAFHSDQMQAIREGAEATIPRGGTMPPDAAVQQGMKDAFEATRAREFPPVDATVGGKRLVGYVDRGIKAQRKTVSSLYDDVRASVQAEAPVLSLKGPKELAAQRSVPAVAADGTQIDLRKPPTGEYKAVLDDIAALPDTATYDQVQELRSRIGRLQNMDPARLAESNADTADLVRLDAAFAETLRTPLNDAPGYVSALSKASDARKELGVLQKLDGVRKAARAKKTEQWNKLFNSLATSPDALEPRLLSAIDKAGPRNANAYRQTILRSVAASDDPLAAWSRLQQKGGEGFEWLTKNPGVRETMDTVVRAAKEINSSQFKEAWDRATIKSGFAQEALEKSASDGASSRSLVSQLGGRGSEGHEALRTAIYERAIQRSIGRNESAGVDAIDPKALGASIKEMKDKRWWSEILTKEDQAKLEGLLAQSRLSWQGGGLGDGLVIASLARKIFSLQAHEAVSEIGASRMFARLLMNKSYNKNALPKAAARLQTTGKPAFSGDWPRAIATTMTSLGLNYPATE
jgi:hypothetical protein